MKKVILLAIALCAVFLWIGTSFAYNITVYDQRSTDTAWYGEGEDQEVEPGMVTGQEWDLEAFLLDGTSLSMVGGFNFVNGYDNRHSGDIFIDTTGDALYGDNAVGGIDQLGWDYVIDVDWGNGSYEVYKLTKSSTYLDVTYYNSLESSPWRRDSGGEKLAFPWGEGSFNQSDFDDAQGTHYQVSGFDLSFLGDDISAFTAKFTMECGNDNLIGQVPEPTTMLLLGVGLIGLAGFGRRKLKRKV